MFLPKTGAQISFLFLSKVLAFLFIVSGCVVVGPPPYEEYTLARAAVKSAQEADSSRFAVGLWSKAESNYKAGEKAFNESEYDQAKKFFRLAITYSERAENATRLKKFQSG